MLTPPPGATRGREATPSFRTGDHRADPHSLARDASGFTGAVLNGALKKDAYWDVTYGRGDYGMDRAVSIVGVRTGARWSVFAQKQDCMSGDDSVRKVKRIF